MYKSAGGCNTPNAWLKNAIQEEIPMLEAMHCIARL
jgi:hypothetical protein